MQAHMVSARGSGHAVNSVQAAVCGLMRGQAAAGWLVWPSLEPNLVQSTTNTYRTARVYW